MYPVLETQESLSKSEHDYSIWDHPLEAGRHIPLHWHDYFEFELVVKGELKHLCNGRDCRATTGSAYLMSFQNFHELTALTDTHIYSLHFDKKLLPPEILPWIGYHDLHFQFNEKETRQLENRFLELLKENDQKLPFYAMNSRSIITEIIVTAIRKATNNSLSATPLPIQQAVSYINEHFQEQLTLAELAATLSFSPNYLGMLFKKQMNCTFHEYLNTLRLKHACNLLSFSNMSVKEISFSSGYSSVEYFMYAFKKMMMMTPNEYRKAHQANIPK